LFNIAEVICRKGGIFLMVFIFASCNENFTGGSRWETPPQQEEQFAPIPQEFTTRLSPTLLIEGQRCRGDETTETFGNGAECDAGQYLIYIDDVNVCDGSGRCTTDVVTPIIGELLNTNSSSTSVSIFDIEPKSLVTQDQLVILKGVAVASDVNGNGTVFFKFGPIANTNKPIPLRIFSAQDLNE
jgi:hypothetical protein